MYLLKRKMGKLPIYPRFLGFELVNNGMVFSVQVVVII